MVGANPTNPYIRSDEGLTLEASACNTPHQRAAPETYPLGSRADDHRLLYGDIIVVNVVKIESSSTTTIHSLFFAKKSRTNSHYSEGE